MVLRIPECAILPTIQRILQLWHGVWMAVSAHSRGGEHYFCLVWQLTKCRVPGSWSRASFPPGVITLHRLSYGMCPLEFVTSQNPSSFGGTDATSILLCHGTSQHKSSLHNNDQDWTLARHAIQPPAVAAGCRNTWLSDIQVKNSHLIQKSVYFRWYADGTHKCFFIGSTTAIQ